VTDMITVYKKTSVTLLEYGMNLTPRDAASDKKERLNTHEQKM